MRLVLLFIVLGSWLLACGQPVGVFSVRVLVLEAATNDPLPFATIQVLQAEKQVRFCTTDFEGAAKLDELAAGSYRVVVSMEGYRSTETLVAIDDTSTLLQLSLVPYAGSYKPVDIVNYQVPLIDYSGGSAGATVTRDYWLIDPLAVTAPFTSNVPNLYPPLMISAALPVTSAVPYSPYNCSDTDAAHWRFLDTLYRTRPKVSLSIFEQGGKKGIETADGLIIADPVYNNIVILPGIEVYRFLVQQEERFGLMDEKGKWLIPCDYDRIYSVASRTSCIHKRHLLVVVKDGNFGLMTTQGDPIGKLQYDHIELPGNEYACPARSQLMRVAKEGKYGYMNENGDLIVDPVFDSIGLFESNFAKTFLHGKQGLIRYDGSVFAEPLYDQVMPEPYGTVALVAQGEKWGVIGASAFIQIPFDYEAIRLGYSDDQRLFFVDSEAGWGLLNDSGEVVIPARYQGLRFIEPYSNLLQYRQKSAYGILSLQGEVLQAARFDELVGHGQTHCSYRIGSKWGFVYDTGRAVSPALYDEIQASEYSYYSVRKGAYYGVCDATGRVILKPEFEVPLELYDLYYTGLTSFEKDGKFGLVDQHGRIRCKPVYDYYILFQDYDSTATHVFVQYNARNGKPVLLNSDGVELIGPLYDAFFELDELPGYYVTELEGRQGLVSAQGKLVCAPTYDAIEALRTVNRSDYRGPGFQVRKNGKTGLVGENASVLIPLIYDEMWELTDTSLGVRAGDSSGVINYKGELLLPMQPYQLKYSSGAFYVALNAVHRYVLLNASGEQIGQTSYSRVEPLSPGSYFKIYNGALEGILSASGTVLLEPVYENVKFYGPDFFAVKQGDLYAFADSSGKLLTGFNFEKVKNVQQDLVVVRMNNHFGVVNRRGEEVLPAVFDLEIDLSLILRRPFTSLRSEGKYGLVDSGLNVVLPPIFDEEIRVESGRSFMVVKKNGLYGVLDREFNETVPFIYPSLQSIEAFDHLFLVELDDRWGVVDASNKIVIPVEYTVVLPYPYAGNERAGYGFLVSKNGKLALMSAPGELLTDFKYEAWGQEEGGVIYVQKEGRSYVLNSFGIEMPYAPAP